MSTKDTKETKSVPALHRCCELKVHSLNLYLAESFVQSNIQVKKVRGREQGRSVSLGQLGLRTFLKYVRPSAALNTSIINNQSTTCWFCYKLYQHIVLSDVQLQPLAIPLHNPLSAGAAAHWFNTSGFLREAPWLIVYMKVIKLIVHLKMTCSQPKYEGFLGIVWFKVKIISF